MKAAVAKKSKSPWTIEDMPEPKVAENQVLIKIKASGICYTDVHQTQGDLPGDFPRILGHEPVGEVVAVGPGVSSRKIGDRVGVPWVQIGCGRCEWCLRGKSNFCANQLGTSMQMSGGHAQLMVAYASATMLIPENLSYEQAAPIFCAGYTVWSGLRWAEPQPGEKVAVVGIGGLGHLAVQYAAATGFDVLAVSRSPDKDNLIKQLGAAKIVRDGDGLNQAGGADVILCTGNSAASMVDAVKGARPDARLVVMGVDTEPLQFSTTDFIMKRLKVIGSQQNRPEFLLEALNLVASGKVRVHTETYEFGEILKAYERVEQGKVRFRAVVTFD